MYLNVGDLVYRPYVPQSPGKVIWVFDRSEMVVQPETKRRLFGAVIVRWLDKTETYEEATQLNKLMHLIEDHRRRLSKHEAKLPALEAL